MYAYTGGKTGGHILPLISIIQKSGADAVYIGQKGNLEERLCRENRIQFIGLERSKHKLIGSIKGYFALKKELKKYPIDAVITSGGFVSVSACLYALRKKIPLFLLEENVVVGSFNQMMYPFCRKMFLAYKIDGYSKKSVLSGIPLRPQRHSFEKERYDVLIIGGSLGSKVLCDLASTVSKTYKTCLIAGRYAKETGETDNLTVIEFSKDIYSLMASSKVIIARAGAATTAEIFYINKPLICIPSMKTKKNHQYYNAKYFSERNACTLCLENDAKKHILSHIQNLLENDNLRVNMLTAQRKLVQPEAADLILREIKESIS